MRRTVCLALFCVALSVVSAQAAVVTSVTANSTTGIAGITSWPTAFTDSSTPSTTPANNPAEFNVNENNWGGSSLFSLGQSWKATTSGSLSNLQITISGTAPVSFNVAVYDAGANDVSDIGSGAYTPGSGGYSNNLLNDTSVQTWGGFTQTGATAAVLNFALSGADQIPITAGKSYIFEISSTSNLSNMVWFRNGATGNYVDGQAFRQRSPLNGNPARDMALAVTVTAVPEPASLSLVALGIAAIAASKRRRAR